VLRFFLTSNDEQKKFYSFKKLFPFSEFFTLKNSATVFPASEKVSLVPKFLPNLFSCKAKRDILTRMIRASVVGSLHDLQKGAEHLSRPFCQSKMGENYQILSMPLQNQSDHFCVQSKHQSQQD